MARATVLVVEDCPDTANAIRRALQRDQQVQCAGSRSEARELAQRASPDLALVDLDLPDGSGFDLCRELRELPGFQELPVMFLTASRDTRDKVTAFQLDADDYLEKPFDALELQARVGARLRKLTRAEESRRVIRIGTLQADAASHRVWSQAGGELELTPHEFQMLYVLGMSLGEVVTRVRLLEEIWQGVSVTGRTVDTHLCNLRRKLGEFAPDLCVETVRGLGYRLSANSP